MPLPELIAALQSPPPVLERLRALPGLHVVGGYLRDAWLGRPTRDVDIVCSIPQFEALPRIELALGSVSFEMSERFRSHRLVCEGWEIDVSPMHEAGVAADLARRDYGVNALMYPLERCGPNASAEYLQAADGALDDLAAARLRSISLANLADDPLRVVRGYRLAAVLGLRPDAATRGQWQGLAEAVLQSAPERLREELLHWFAAQGSIVETLRWAGEDGALFEIFPGLAATQGCEQNVYHHLDVWNHTLEALQHFEELSQSLPDALQPWAEQFRAASEAGVTASASAGTLTRIALLLHDVAKPPTRAVRDDGQVTFYNHQDIGAEMMEPVLRRLRFATDEVEYILLMIRQHLRLGFYCRQDPLTPKLIYRFVRELGPATPMALLHSIADCMATRGRLSDGSLDHHTRAAAVIMSHYCSADSVVAPPVLLDGTAIMELLGIEPGRIVGELKEALLEATACGEVSSESEAREFVRQAYEQAARP